jgi:DNA-binding NarL/FixJ family response regulator
VNDERLVILIVDDSALIIEKMIRMLQDLDNIRIVFQASNYAEAITIIRETEPDIVIMDIFLQDHIGIDLLKFVQGKYGDIEIVVLTNHVGEHYRDICKKMGAHHFLDKSSDFDLIPKMIHARRRDVIKKAE